MKCKIEFSLIRVEWNPDCFEPRRETKYWFEKLVRENRGQNYRVRRKKKLFRSIYQVVPFVARLLFRSSPLTERVWNRLGIRKIRSLRNLGSTV